jgi:hypothetical protein
LGEEKFILLLSAWKKSSAFTAHYGRFGRRFTPPFPLMKVRRSFYPATLITTRLSAARSAQRAGAFGSAWIVLSGRPLVGVS